VRVYPTPEYARTFRAAPRHVQETLLRDLNDILSRGAACIDAEDLHSRIIDNWFLHFRYPKAGEEYEPNSYILVRVVEERAP
jgi:hypothetical protein